MNLKLVSVMVTGLLSAAPAFASTVTLDFEGAPSFASVGNFYGSLGLEFGGGALGVVNDELGPYFSSSPSPGTVMAPVGADSSLFATPGSGLIGSVSFSYSSTAAAVVRILDSVGAELGHLDLLANATAGGCSDSPRCNWSPVTVAFSGMAKSIEFGGGWDEGAGTLAFFDDVTVSTVPLPAAVWLLLSGLGGIGALGRRKRAS